MMKHTKKLLALALVFAMALMLAVPAFADVGDGPEIPLPNITGSGEDNANHNYTIYQIFTGVFVREGEKDLLTEVKWGSGVNGEALITALTGNAYTNAYMALSGRDTAANPFEGITFNGNRPNISADAVARVLARMDLAENSDEARAFAEVVLKNGLGTGTDVTNGYTVPADGFYLTVDTMNDTNATGARSLYMLSTLTKDSNYTPMPKVDVPKLDKQVLEVNDSVPANAQGNGWADVADYDIGDEIPFVLSGTVSTRYDDFKVYKYVFHDKFSAGLTFNANSLKVYIDGKEVSRDSYTLSQGEGTFTVTFANLKNLTEVKAGSVIQVLYTATLGENAVIGGKGNTNTAHLEFSNDPNSTDEGEPPTGNTPEDTVTVFTFKLNVKKVDESREALKGAGFTLYKKYTVAPDGATQLEGVDGFYPVMDEIVGGDRTEFEFKGLDSGEYLLRETTVPGGYNPAEDVYFTVEATRSADEESITKVEVKNVHDTAGKEIVGPDGEESVVFNVETLGELETSIVNLRGVILPGTGGIGTTIFYVLGGLLLVGAGVVLIARKRMGKAE